MEDVKNFKIEGWRLGVGAVALAGGFWLLSTFSWAWWALFIGGLIAWAVVFQGHAREAFSMPKKLWVIPIGIVVYLLFGLVVGNLAVKFGLNWSANPAAGHLGLLIFKIPFMLMGEELLGIGILEAARNKGASLTTSTLLSALIFGLMHVFVYWDGSWFSTLLHVLLLQGVARLIFNYVYLLMGKSIWGSWLTHVGVDLLALL